MLYSQQLEKPGDESRECVYQSPAPSNVQQYSDTKQTASEEPAVHIKLGSVVKKDQSRRALVIGAMPLAPFAVLGAIRCLLTQSRWIDLCSNPIFVVTAVAACVAFPIWAIRPSKRARKATGELAKVDDLSAIGSMVDALYYGYETGTGIEVQDALVRLLPQLRATDTHLFSTRQMAVLQSLLTISPNVSGDLFESPFLKRKNRALLQLSILKAFEQIGDERVIHGVRHASMHGVTREVKRAAEECLPFVEQRVELAKASSSLLRASSAGEADTRMLMRSVDSDAYTVPQDEMLRPSAVP